MADLFDYLDWRGDIPFKSVSFGKIDALVLSQIAYLKLEGLLTDSFEDKVSIQELAMRFIEAPDFDSRKYMGMVLNENTPQLLFECGQSVRFKDVTICAFKSVLDEKACEQFAAMTFLVDNQVVIVFRGTDDTLVGWKEDFYIAFMPEIPSQKEALTYVKRVLKNMQGDFSLVGHSKGGNLALYSGVNISKNLKKRLKTIYNFDGPGFSSDFFKSYDFLDVKDKLVSVYPAFSIVGMIFNHYSKFQIIKSTGKNLMQHDSLTWQILGNEFVKEDDFTEQSKFFYIAINEWINKLNPKQIEKFVKSVFYIIESSGVKTNTDLEHTMVKSATKMLKAYNNLDGETRVEVHRILRVLHQVIQNQLPIFSILNFQNLINKDSEKQE